MTPYYEHAGITIYHGDCRDVLPQLEARSARMVWTDPPYGLSFNDGDLAHRWEKARAGTRARPKENNHEHLITNP